MRNQIIRNKDSFGINEINATYERKIQYSLLLNNKRYKDFSVVGILKILYHNHKISKVQYKESIKRLKENRKLRNSVYTKVMFYLKTIKAHKGKSSLNRLNKNESRQYKQYIILRGYNNLSYSVYIKKRILNRLFEKDLCIEYKDLLSDKIRLQFNSKLRGGNKE